jgi:hypothetical protein
MILHDIQVIYTHLCLALSVCLRPYKVKKLQKMSKKRAKIEKKNLQKYVKKSQKSTNEGSLSHFCVLGGRRIHLECF